MYTQMQHEEALIDHAGLDFAKIGSRDGLELAVETLPVTASYGTYHCDLCTDPASREDRNMGQDKFKQMDNRYKADYEGTLDHLNRK